MKRALDRLLRRRTAAPAEDGSPVPPRFSYIWLNHHLFPALREPRSPEMRADYLWGVMHAANLARALGLPAVSVAEFGVAGGNGLVALERAAERVEPALGVEVRVFGFDTGRGLPPPRDYRDMPNLYREGAYPMDRERLERRLRRAELRLGLIADTVPAFLAAEPPPVGFIAVDVDYYSSTMDVLRLFDGPDERLLPRVLCYFDDIFGLTCSEYTGERRAIADFNDSHPRRKIDLVPGLEWSLPSGFRDREWPRMFYMAHLFDHPAYDRYDGLGGWKDLELR